MIDNLASLVMVYRIRNDQLDELWHITLNAIEGILRTADKDFELILIDNGSHDDRYAKELGVRAQSFDQKSSFVKGLKQMRFDQPVALSKAWNMGCYQADGDYVIMSNNDIVFHELGWMSRLLEPFTWQNRKIGIVGIQHMSWYKWSFCEGSLFAFPAKFITDFDLRTSPEVSDYPLVFDEQFTLSCEDVDFNARLQAEGYETIQVNDPPLQPRFLQHLGHRTIQSMAGTEENIIEISHENRIRLCRKYGYPDQIID